MDFKSRRKTVYEIAKREAERLGYSVEKTYIKIMEELKIREVLPILAKTAFNKKYVLPHYRQADYYSQDALNYLVMDLITGIAMKVIDPEMKDHVISTHYLNLIRQFEYDRPTFFLEKELIKPMMKTRLPLDLIVSDIKWRYPAFRVYLPKGTFYIERDGERADLMNLDISWTAEEAKYMLSSSIREELMEQIGCEGIPFISTGLKGFGVSGNLNFENTNGPVGYAGTSSLNNLSLKKLLGKVGHDLNPRTPSDEIDDAFVSNMLRLAVNILLFLSQVPIEKQSETSDVIRPPKQEGKRLITGLYKAKFMGETHMRVYNPSKPRTGEPTLTHVKLDSQWRSGHWKRIWYGHKKGEWRFQWIPLYGTGEHKGMDKPDEKN